MSCPLPHHAWKERPRRPGEQYCTECSTLFPCKEVDCGHMDCIAFRRGRGDQPICFFCRKPAEGTDPHPNVIEAGSWRWFTFVNRGFTKVAHSSCYSSHKKEDSSREQLSDEGQRQA